MPTTEDRELLEHPLLSPVPTGRLIQFAFVVLFLGAHAVLFVIAPAAVMRFPTTVAFALVLAATAVTFSPALRGKVFHPLMALIPLADFAAIAITRIDQAGGVTNPAVMMLTLPAIWLGLIGGRMAIVGLIVGVLGVIAPDIHLLATTGELDPIAQRTVMLVIIFPIAMTFASTVASTLARTLHDRQHRLIAEQRRRAEAAREIERGRRLLSMTLDTLDVAVIITTPDGKPLLLNRALRENPLVLRAGGGDAWSGFLRVPTFHFDGREPVAADDKVLARVIRGERVKDRVVWAGDPQSGQRALAVSANTVHTSDGDHLANVIAIADVTPLVETLEVKKDFLAAVSHELRTPLTMLSGVLDLIRDDGLFPDGPAQGWLTVMDRNIARQRRLVDDLLMVASSDRAPLALRVRRAALGPIAREACAAATVEAERAGVRLAWRGDEAHGVFDPERIAQILDNLITNAIRHSATGGDITVETLEDSDRLSLRVSDAGRGMTDEELDHAFDRFYRSTASAEAAVPGTGLGLPIVKLIAEAHGGEVHLRNATGGGLSATVVVPRKPYGDFPSPSSPPDSIDAP